MILLGGPTACGKTALSVQLARQLGAEIISADSMQVYKGLTVGTAQVTPEEMGGVVHHLVNFLDPEVPYSAADFVEQADACIRDIHARGKLALVVGGTGLYLSSLLDGRRIIGDSCQRRQASLDGAGRTNLATSRVGVYIRCSLVVVRASAYADERYQRAN